MAKILGMTEQTHKGLGALFLAGYLFAMFSAYLNLKQGEPEGARFLFISCTVTGLLPAIIFMYLGIQLQRKRTVLENVNQFLRSKARVSAQEVASQFGWTEMEAEEKIVEVLSEEMILGHFDRGSHQFYVQGAQESMDFVDKCANCGADVGLWVSKTQPSICPYCESETRGTFEPPQMEIKVSTQSANVTVGAPSEAPTGEGAPQQPSHIVESTFSGKAQQPMVAERPPAPQPPPAVAPPVQAQPTPAPAMQAPPAQAPTPGMAPAPTVAPTVAPTQIPFDHFAQGKKKGTIRYLFFSLKPGALKTVGIVIFIIGIMFTGATIAVGYGMFSIVAIMILMVWLWLPPLLIGALLIRKAYTHGRYKTELIDISDYLATYRKIDFVTLARKMQLPDERVRKIIDDILAFELLEGQVTPDGKEFHMNLRPEDTQTIQACPYCKASGLSVQVIRGGSEKCPYCGGVIYFTEGVRA